MAVKIQIEKPPVYGAVKGFPGLAASSPWTDAQRTAGMRRKSVPDGGIGTNRVAPPPPPQVIYQPNPRDQLTDIINGHGRGGGYDNNPMTSGNVVNSPTVAGGLGGYSMPAGFTPAGTTMGHLPGWLSSIMPSWATGGANLGSNPGWGYNSQGNRSSATGAGGSHGMSSGGYSTSGRGW